LPKRDGLSLIEELRRKGVSTPVLILSARRSVDDRVAGLQTGGDDYLTKPFAFAELLARVQALVRRATRTPEPTTLTVDDVVLGLALWYATLFVAGSIASVFVTYYLTAVSLAQRDQQIIKGKLGDYAAAYARGGVRVLAATVRAEQQAAPERLFVRVVDRGVEAVVLSNPEGWDSSKLETVSARLDDGTLVQVGKSTEAREGLL